MDIISIAFNFSVSIYRFFLLPIKSLLVRRKGNINVGFVLSDLGKWKTELLFKKLLEHERFTPVVLVVPYLNNDNSGQNQLIKYLLDKKYPFYVYDNNRRFSDDINLDIIFYQEPYGGIINKRYEYKHNLSSLFCYVPYAFHTIDSNWSLDTPLLNFAWQVFFENSLVLKNVSFYMTNGGKNCKVTGLPFTDLFKEHFFIDKNPWKYQIKPKKKIIWAPHHTILSETLICYSTFLMYCDTMFSLALKFKDDIQIAFKPHPVLLTKLYNVWGKEKTDNYYSLWEKGENTQLVLGDYVPLFFHSDAMIHDCGSFTVEYHYTRNPVMYLLKDDNHSEELNEFGKMAFNLHYKGRNVDDIETFIKNVIAEVDPMKEERDKFYNDYLRAPEGNSASDNIINAILG